MKLGRCNGRDGVTEASKLRLINLGSKYRVGNSTSPNIGKGGHADLLLTGRHLKMNKRLIQKHLDAVEI